MEHVTWAVDEAEAIVCKAIMPLTKTSSAAFTETVRPVLCCYNRKLMCTSVKEPNVLRVMNQHGKHADITVKLAAVRHISCTESQLDRPPIFYAVGDKNLSLITPGFQASGDLSIDKCVERSFDEDIMAVTPGDDGKLFVLGQGHIIELLESTGATETRIDLAPRTAVQYPAFAYHHRHQVLVAPSKSAHLDIISSRSRKSVLPKAWEPHVDAKPCFARFFQTRAFEDSGHREVLILTAAHDNSELRFWAFNVDTQKFSLKQEISIVSKAGGVDAFDISVTPTEEYITLTSRNHAYAVVIETHRSLFNAHRITTWKTVGPSLCSSTYIGKVSESTAKTSVSCELFIVTRTSDGLFKMMLDANSLAGASNMAAQKQSSVSNWFPAANASSSHGGAPLTAVHSSLGGDNKAGNAITEANAAKLVSYQSMKLCEQLATLDVELVEVQKAVSSNMCMFQESLFKDTARTTGRNFATRNSGRLGADAQTVTEPGVTTESQRELLLAIDSFVKEVEGTTHDVAAKVLKTLLRSQLKQSVEKASRHMETLSVSGTADMNINSTNAARTFRNDVDAAARSMVNSTKEMHALMKTTLETSASDTESIIQRSHNFTAEMDSLLKSLKQEITDVRDTMVHMQSSGGVAPPVDPEALVARAVERAESGDWPGAVTVALEAGDITVLLGFLESPVSQQNMQTLVSHKTLPLPLFLSVCHHLVFELNSQPGAIPLRVMYLHRFYVEWDDHLKTLKTQAAKGGAPSNVFELAKRELTSVIESVDQVDVQSIDRKSRNNLRLVRKLIASLVSE